ncbi:mucin-17-like [Bradysia coprophila]|uniref:mucin-17-like n=1 Tax=Bradysia coprophila TaxID=38358 RepID=UPI00187DB7B7|nr:mucin-17-like [Bradysia coprophila]
MSSPNHSTCLIDLSGSNESPTSSTTTPLMMFPPISADEMIVPLKRFSINSDPFGTTDKRFSISNDPFDTIEKQAKLFGDPFEIVNMSSPREAIHDVSVPTAKLVDFDGSSNSIQLSQDNSQDTLNRGMCTFSSITTNSSLVDGNSSDTMNRAFVNSDSSVPVQNNGNRNRISSDPVASKSKAKRKIGSGKARCASLEQLCLKNQFRKSLTNSPIASPKAVKVTHSLDNSSLTKTSNTTDFNLTSESIFDDLLSTNPEWIESDNDDSDYERMTIPFLKNIQHNESTIASTDCSSDRSTTLATIEKLSKYREATESVADVPQSEDASEDKTEEKPVDKSPPEDNITSIIETLRNAVKNCGDAKKKSEASVLLDSLNVCLKTAGSTSSTTTATIQPEPHQFVRQRTFSVEDQLDDTKNNSPIQVTKELSSSLPPTSGPTRKSVNGTTSITPRRFSRSMTYTGKPVSVVTAVQSQTDSSDRRRSSVCTTPTRLVRQSSNPPTRNTRTSLGRQSLSSSHDEKTVVKPVPRKTIMKASNPTPSSTVTRPLKLRVGEQTKPNGPLKAVIPYQRSSTLPNHSEPSIKAKRTVKTSTPLAPSNVAKSSIPAASSTPVINTGKQPSLLSLRHAQSRLSFTPSTPVAATAVNRQPCSERKKRSVTFSEESDKFSQSMIVGTKQSSVQAMYSLQRRRLSQSYGTNKENSILHQK